MANIRHHTFFVEPFTYHGRASAEPRYRPVGAVALLRAGGATAPMALPQPARNVNLESLSMLGAAPATDDGRGNRCFLPLFDHVHLLGAPYGGTDDSFNLIPILRRSNRGGSWSAFETAIRDQGGPAILAVKCTYNALEDPRIPAAVEAALIPIADGSGAILDTEWAGWLANFRALIRDAGEGRLATYLAGGLLPRIQSRTEAIRHYCFTQDPFHVVVPYYALTDAVSFQTAFNTALHYVDRSGWRVEADGRAPFESAPVAANTLSRFTARFRLPDQVYRPYAALDYMALTGQLDNMLVGASNGDHNIAGDGVYDAATFNPAMKSFAMYANAFRNYNRMAGQAAYYSDAADYIAHPDRGTVGAGIVAEPEFDHVIPRTPPDGGPAGPTIFSNLQLTSRGYHRRKGDHLWVPPQFSVGVPRATMQVAHAGSQRSGEYTGPFGRKRAYDGDAMAG